MVNPSQNRGPPNMNLGSTEFQANDVLVDLRPLLMTNHVNVYFKYIVAPDSNCWPLASIS